MTAPLKSINKQKVQDINNNTIESQEAQNLQDLQEIELNEDTASTDLSFSPNNPNPLTPDATILIFGPASSGKTTLLRRIVTNTFTDAYLPTQLDQRTTRFNKADGYAHDCILTFYDVAGQEDYQYYYRSFVDLCSIIFLCFPIGDKCVLETIESTYMPVLTFLSSRIPPLIYLVGTKKDLVGSVPIMEMNEYKMKLGRILKGNDFKYFETSSLAGTGHVEIMQDVIKMKSKWPIEAIASVAEEKKKVQEKERGRKWCCF
ncbi:Ras-like GTP-binding protein RhoL [Cucumispora dikerogammari]|nr:Ras-like GTP-binding protein RhoL [Cucumispora dikerogammari]